MAIVSHAHTEWEGTLFEGSGTVFFDSSDLPQQKVTWKARAEEHGGLTSPEELIAAAHSSCFSMALSNALAKAGTPAKSLHTEAQVTFQPGEGIKGIHIVVRGEVPGMSDDDFVKAAEGAKENCPVSKALAATPITLDAALK